MSDKKVLHHCQAVKARGKRKLEDVQGTNTNYRDLIIIMVGKMKNQDYLRKIYSFVKVFSDD